MIALPSYDKLIHQVSVVLVSTEQTDLNGGLAPVDTVVLTGVNCLVIGRTGDRSDRAGRELEVRKFTVTFLDPIDLKQGNVLVQTLASGDTRRLLVDTFKDDQDMGRIWVAGCTLFVNPTGE